MWLLEQLTSGNAAYHIPVVVRLRGPVNVVALEQSLDEIVRRHEVLRTTFSTIDGQPFQTIVPSLKIAMPTVNLQSLSEHEREAEAQRLVLDQVQRPFNLAQGPILRAALLQLSEGLQTPQAEEHVLMLVTHHIVFDGWSINILLRELAALYGTCSAGKPSPLPELPIQYVDYAVWQRQRLQGEALEAQLAYWKQKLASAPAVLVLPTDRPRPAVQSFRGAHQFFELPSGLTKALKTLSRQEKGTLFMLLLMAFKLLLFHYSGQDAIVVGVPVLNRNPRELEKLIGFFANTLVLHTDLSGNPSLRELFGRVREVVTGAYAHQEVPFEQVVEVIHPERSTSYNPLFQVMFNFLEAPNSTVAVAELEWSLVNWESEITDFDLFLTMSEQDGRLCGSWGYSTDLFDAATITRMIGLFQSLLESIVLNLEQRLSDLPLLQRQTIAVTAMFTAELLKEPLSFWMKQLDIPSRIEFAPYNQVFQQLLDPSGLLSKNEHGINVILLLLEDWFQDKVPPRAPLTSYEEERLLTNRRRCRLPNGLEVVHLNQRETDFVYQETFVNRTYFRHGITLNEGDCVVDVGANIGLFTLYVHHQCKNVHIYAFEPVPPLFELLKTNVASHGVNATLFECGLSNRTELAQFTYYPNYSTMSSLRANAEQDRETIKSIALHNHAQNLKNTPATELFTKYLDEFVDDLTEEQVVDSQLRTLSSVIKECNIGRIDLLKIDVEREEWNVLCGIEAKDWEKIKQIVIEVHDKKGNLRDQIVALLMDKGYRLVVEQEEGQQDSGLYNIYAIQCNQEKQPRTHIVVSEQHRVGEQIVCDFIRALKSAAGRSATPYLVFICPALPRTLDNPQRKALLESWEERMALELDAVSNVYLTTSSELTAVYSVSTYYDPHGNELGHIPYTSALFAALGTLTARKIYTLNHSPYKVIVLDCDQTLWKGVSGEDGPAGVEIAQPWKSLQEFMVTQHNAGMLLCLCSKNVEEDVVQVFSHHPEMPLTRDHIVSWRINWRPKSENIRSLAEELHLGLDSFIFLDDNPAECAEVRANCPEVLTLQLPAEPHQIPRFLQHMWAFDHLKVTSEDKARTRMYVRNLEREHLRQGALTLEDFLASLELQVSISAMKPSQLARVAQLMQRTNQFNTTTRRYTDGEIQKLYQVGKECWVVEVRDRFGDYGLVGVMIFEAGTEAIRVDTFLMSCRVLGRGVEQRMLVTLAQVAQERELERVDVVFIPSKKNQPAADFLHKVGIQFKQAAGEGFIFQYPVSVVAATCANAFTQPVPNSDAPIQEGNLSPATSPSMLDPGRESARLARIATELYQTDLILAALEYQKGWRTRSRQPYAAPKTEIEEILGGIWTQLLHVRPIGRCDNFFELGGNSLLVTQVVSRIREVLKVELPAHSFFQTPTIAGLAECITASRQRGLQVPLIKPVPRVGPLPLSFGQERLWMLNQFDPGNSAYHIPSAWRIQGPLDTTVLEQCINEVVRRHEILRTTFSAVEARPVQVIAPALFLPLLTVDLSPLAQPEREAEALRLAAEDIQRPFDLARGPLLRATLLRLDREEHLLVMIAHHIVSDGLSDSIFNGELAALYTAFIKGDPSPLADLSIQYADYAVWQRQWLEGPVLQTQFDYWQQQLAGAPERIELPTDHPRPPVQTGRGAVQSFTLSRERVAALEILSQRNGVSLFMTLLAAFKTLLYRYSGQGDIIVGCPLANRRQAGTEGLIGLFANILVIRSNLSDAPGFRELLGRVRKATLEAYDHQDVPFEKLVKLAGHRRNPGFSPLFQVMFNFLPEETLPAVQQIPGLRISPVDAGSTRLDFDLMFILREHNGELQGWMEYAQDLFEATTITRMLGHWEVLLGSVVECPDMPVTQIPLMTAIEREQVRAASAISSKQKLSPAHIRRHLRSQPAKEKL
jgi:FkbH-like protein/FkbM family methyltransferase